MFKLRNLFVGALLSLVMVFGFAMTAQACDWCDDEFGQLYVVHYSVGDLPESVLDYIENGYTLIIVDSELVILNAYGDVAYISEYAAKDLDGVLVTPFWGPPNCCGWTRVEVGSSETWLREVVVYGWVGRVLHRGINIHQHFRTTFNEVWQCPGTIVRTWTEEYFIFYGHIDLGPV